MDPVNVEIPIKFVEKQLPISNIVQTGDGLGLAVITLFLIALLSIAGFIYANLHFKPYLYNKFRADLLVDSKSKIALLFVSVAAICSFILLLCFSQLSYGANADKDYKFASDEIVFEVDPNTGEISNAEGYIKNPYKNLNITVTSSYAETTSSVQFIKELYQANILVTGLNADLLNGNCDKKAFKPTNTIDALFPGDTSELALYLSNISPENAKQLIDKTAFHLVITVGEAISDEPVLVSTDMTYNGSIQNVLISGNGLSFSGDTTGKNAGDYVASVSPKNGWKWANPEWDTVTIPWTIKKAKPKLNLDSKHIDVTTGITGNANFSYDGDGTVEATVQPVEGIEMEDIATATVNMSSHAIGIDAGGWTDKATILLTTKDSTNYFDITKEDNIIIDVGVTVTTHVFSFESYVKDVEENDVQLRNDLDGEWAENIEINDIKFGTKITSILTQNLEADNSISEFLKLECNFRNVKTTYMIFSQSAAWSFKYVSWKVNDELVYTNRADKVKADFDYKVIYTDKDIINLPICKQPYSNSETGSYRIEPNVSSLLVEEGSYIDILDDGSFYVETLGQTYKVILDEGSFFYNFKYFPIGVSNVDQNAVINVKANTRLSVNDISLSGAYLDSSEINPSTGLMPIVCLNNQEIYNISPRTSEVNCVSLTKNSGGTVNSGSTFGFAVSPMFAEKDNVYYFYLDEDTNDLIFTNYFGYKSNIHAIPNAFSGEKDDNKSEFYAWYLKDGFGNFHKLTTGQTYEYDSKTSFYATFYNNKYDMCELELGCSGEGHGVFSSNNKIGLDKIIVPKGSTWQCNGASVQIIFEDAVQAEVFARPNEGSIFKSWNIDQSGQIEKSQEFLALFDIDQGRQDKITLSIVADKQDGADGYILANGTYFEGPLTAYKNWVVYRNAFNSNSVKLCDSNGDIVSEFNIECPADCNFCTWFLEDQQENRTKLGQAEIITEDIKLVAVFTPVAKAVYTSDNSGNTLTFYYDRNIYNESNMPGFVASYDVIHTHDYKDVYNRNSIEPQWAGNVDPNTIKFDSSFAKFHMYSNSSNLKNEDYSGENFSSIDLWFKDFQNVLNIINPQYLNGQYIDSMNRCFSNFKYKGVVDLTSLTATIQSASGAFYHADIEGVDLSNATFSEQTNCDMMFLGINVSTLTVGSKWSKSFNETSLADGTWYKSDHTRYLVSDLLKGINPSGSTTFKLGYMLYLRSKPGDAGQIKINGGDPVDPNEPLALDSYSTCSYAINSDQITISEEISTSSTNTYVVKFISSDYEFKYWTIESKLMPSSGVINSALTIYANSSKPSPKAIFNNGIFTFYCDTQIHEGQYIFEVPESWDYDSYEEEDLKNQGPFYTVRYLTTKVVFDQSFSNFDKLQNMCLWFSQFYNLNTVTGTKFINTKAFDAWAAGIQGAFRDCVNLEVVDFDNNFKCEFDDLDFSETFYNCSKLKSVDLSGVKGNWLNVRYAFYNCRSLEFFNLSNMKCYSFDPCFSNLFSLKSFIIGPGIGRIFWSDYNYESDITLPDRWYQGNTDTAYDVHGLNTIQDSLTEITTFTRQKGVEIYVSPEDAGDIEPDYGFFTRVNDSLRYVVNDVTKEGNLNVASISFYLNEQSPYTIKVKSEYDFIGWTFTPDSSEGTVISLMRATAVFNKPEGKALYDASNNELRFVYDSKVYYGYERLPLYKDYKPEDPDWDLLYPNTIKKVIFDDSFYEYKGITSTSAWFSCGYNSSSLESIEGLNNIDTSDLEDISYMFNGCALLKEIIWTNINLSKVKDASWLFYSDVNLEVIDFGSYDKEKSISQSCNTNSMLCAYDYRGISNLKNVNISKFTNCDVNGMLNSWNDYSSIIKFYLPIGATQLISDNWFDENNNFYSSNVFENPLAEPCLFMKGRHISFDSIPPDSCTFECSQSIDLENFYYNVSYPVRVNFDNNVIRFTSEQLGNISVTAKATGGHYFYEWVSDPKIMDNDEISSDISFTAKLDGYSAKAIKKEVMLQLVYDNDPHFGETWYPVDPNWQNKDTSPFPDPASYYVVNIDSSFANYKELKSLNSWFNGFANVVRIEGLEYLDTINVTSMVNTFKYCENLISFDLSKFRTDNVTSFEGLFYHCYKIKTLDCSSFNTSKATNMTTMFYHCEALENLNVASFDTSKVTTIYSTFSYATSLKHLDLSSWSNESIKSVMLSWSGDYNLEKIYVNTNLWKSDHNYDFHARTFMDCNKLEGGQGTHYKEYEIMSSVYARADRDYNNLPGLMTKVNTDEDLSSQTVVDDTSAQTINDRYEAAESTAAEMLEVLAIRPLIRFIDWISYIVLASV